MVVAGSKVHRPNRRRSGEAGIGVEIEPPVSREVESVFIDDLVQLAHRRPELRLGLIIKGLVASTKRTGAIPLRHESAVGVEALDELIELHSALGLAALDLIE